MPKRHSMRRLSFTVAVVRNTDGSKQWHTKCNRCGQVLNAVTEMTRHANIHIAEQDAAVRLKRIERQREQSN